MEVDIKLRDYIYVNGVKAMVCHIRNNCDVEVIYESQNKKEIINEDAILENGKWAFKISGPSGGYAEKSPRLNEFVALFKAYK